MDDCCTACEKLRTNLSEMVTGRLRRLAPDDSWTATDRFKEADPRSMYDYRWRCNFVQLVRAANAGCSFCTFLDYVIISRWYDDDAVLDLDWMDGIPSSILEKATIERADLRRIEKDCLVCGEDWTSQGTKGKYYCEKCEPRVAQFIAKSIKNDTDDRLTSIMSNLELLSSRLFLGLFCNTGRWIPTKDHDGHYFESSDYLEMIHNKAGRQECNFRLRCENGTLNRYLSPKMQVSHGRR